MHGMLPLDEVSFVDDAVFAVLCSASGLTCKLQAVAQVIHEVFVQHGFEINYKPGKTEAVCLWAGPGMAAARRELQLCQDSIVRCAPARGSAFALRVVPGYKHLGTRTLASGSLSHEITVRAAILRSESRALSRKVLANEAVAVSRRSLLAQSLVFSKGFFNSGTWAGLTSSQVGKVHAAGLQVYRIVAGQCSDGTSSVATDDAVIEELSAIAPAVMVRMSRMCLFVRVSARRPLALMRYLEVARAYRASWLEDVRKDFEWISMVSEDFVSWRGLSLRDHAVAAGSSAHKMKIKIAELCRCRAANACISWATTVSQRQLATSWLCPECRQQHKSKQALAVHRARRHGVKRAMRQYVDTTHCAVCLLEFHDVRGSLRILTTSPLLAVQPS